MRAVDLTILRPLPSAYSLRSGLGKGEARTANRPTTTVGVNPEHVGMLEPHAPLPLSITVTEGQQESVYSGSAPCCILHLNDHFGSPPRSFGQDLFVAGSVQSLRRVLGTGPADLGIYVTLESGDSMTVSGTILGPVTIKSGETLHLDPAYLDGGEWSLSRPTGSNPRYKIAVLPDRAFGIEKKNAPAEPGGTPTWSALTTTIRPQAACTLRPER